MNRSLPPLAFRVGVVGHRPPRLRAARADLPVLRRVVSDLLQTVQSAVRAVSSTTDAAPCAAIVPEFCAVSPLAEGTDRIFAEEALALGWHLCCVMPFAQADYERDFSGPSSTEVDSLERFRRILHTAAVARRLTRLEFAFPRSDADSDAYGLAGELVLRLCDLLIVVWDGNRTGKKGGTEETMAVALAGNHPVVLVDARAPHAWRLPRVPDASAGEAALAALHRSIREKVVSAAPAAHSPRRSSNK